MIGDSVVAIDKIGADAIRLEFKGPDLSDIRRTVRLEMTTAQASTLGDILKIFGR